MTLALLSWIFCTVMLKTLASMNVELPTSKDLIQFPVHSLARPNLVSFLLHKCQERWNNTPLKGFLSWNLLKWKHPTKMLQLMVLLQDSLFQLKIWQICARVKMHTLRPGSFLPMIQHYPLNGTFKHMYFFKKNHSIQCFLTFKAWWKP